MDKVSLVNIQSPNKTSDEGRPRMTSTIRSILEPRDFISSRMPYADKRYDLTQYNPPPLELGWMGGLGKKSGNVRTKAHVQRPTMNQILFRMRSANRILVTFSEDPALTHSLTRKQLEISSKTKNLPRNIKKDLNLKISQIQMADNISKISKGSRPSTSTTSETEKLKVEAVAEIPPTITEKRKSKFNIGAVKKISIMTALKTEVPKKPTAAVIEESQSFRAWAIAEREKRFQALQQVSYQQIKQEREANEIFPKIKRPQKIFNASKIRTRKELPGSEHLAGYLYGGFTKVPTTPDITMVNQTKFNVPLTMFSRAHFESKARALSRKKIQNARLDYMKIPQIPSDSEDSDENFEDIKGLSLIRTPYFTIPTIKSHKVKRTERLKSKHLKGNRLKRINMLLFDRKMSAEKHKMKYALGENDIYPWERDVMSDDDEMCDEMPNKEILKEPQALPLIVDAPMNEKKSQYNSQYRQRYHEFVHVKFLEKVEQYNEKLNQKLITFEEFRDNEFASSPASGMTAKTIIDRKSFRDYSTETLSSNILTAVTTPDIQKDPAFKKIKRNIRKNMRFSRNDIKTGEFYFDPFLLEKIHNPEKGMKITKSYTSLMRSQSNIRKRLQVNGPTFDEERCGIKGGSFYHRLVTEWDSYYINEIRHRPTVKKFNVKTDIIKIREMVRKKFFLYFMQEDLMNLFAKQEIESEMINKTTQFIKACEPQFKQLQDEFFHNAKEKLEMVQPVCEETQKSEMKLACLKDHLDLLMQKLMADERKWETIMMMQNYYYLMMLPLWRLENDWIHRNKSGQLDFLKKSVVYCKKFHIRSKCVSEISLHAIKNFFEKSIEANKLNEMRKIKPDVDLLKASLSGIKSNVLGILNAHNDIMMRSSEIIFQQKQLEKMIPVIISAYEKNMQNIEKKVNFIENRIEFLIKEVEITSNLPLIKCVKNVLMRKIAAISSHLCKTLFPETFEIDESIKKYSIVENFSMISNRAFDVLRQLDTLPTETLHIAEYESRLHRRNKMRLGKMAMNEQNLFKMLEKQLKNHFTKTPKPRHKKGKKGKPKMKIVSLFSMVANQKPKLK